MLRSSTESQNDVNFCWFKAHESQDLPFDFIDLIINLLIMNIESKLGVILIVWYDDYLKNSEKMLIIPFCSISTLFLFLILIIMVYTVNILVFFQLRAIIIKIGIVKYIKHPKIISIYWITD